MSLDNFIPTVWSARLLENLHKALVFAQAGIVNRDYEGEIKDVGDTVKINAIGPVTVGNYTKNTNIGDPETLTDAQSSLLIDQSKYFNFQVDDIDKAQQKPKVMDGAMREASYALADTLDGYVAGLHTDAATANLLGTTAVPKTIAAAADVYDYLVDLGVLLDQSNIPSGGRWCIVPPWLHGYLLKDDRFVKSGTPSGDQVLRNGEVGEAAGFRILKSNNVKYTGADYKVMAGSSLAITVAEQINKVEAYRPEKRFADAVKGLHLYGAKVVRPSGLAVLTITKP
jgi:N4-gp56 family major capsid protein